MKALREAGVLAALALAGTGRIWTPKHLKEVSPRVETVIRKRNRPGSRRETVPLAFRLSDLVHRIEQDLGGEPLRIIAGIVLFIDGVILIRQRAQLISV